MFRIAPMLAGFLLMQSPLSAPFMDVFNHHNPAPQLTEQSLQIDGGAGRTLPVFIVTPTVVSGAGPGGPSNRLPAVLLTSGREGLTDALRRFAREMAGIGYVAVAVDFRSSGNAGDSSILAAVLDLAGDLLKVTDWLVAQPGVDPNRLGAVAWNGSFAAAAKLGAAGKVTAVYPQPIESQNRMTEQAWVDIYEFLGKHVEDANLTGPAALETPIARIVDIMRAIMSEQGVRGRLARELASQPADDAQWEQARADAAIAAEAGNLLLAQPPPKGSPVGWRQRATDFRAAAQILRDAVERRDFVAAQDSLRELPRACAACHMDYR